MRGWLVYLSSGAIISRSLSASNEAVGSSNSKYFGFLINALAKAILALCPPDNKHPPPCPT
jgi:hypothetical protein